MAFGAAAAGSAALGWAARRRALAGVAPLGQEWEDLHDPVHGTPVTVRAPDSTRLHAEVLGPKGAPALVLVHGYGLSQHAWHYQRRALSQRFRVVCYDQRGHGASAEAASGDYRMPMLGQDLAAVLSATTEPDEPVLVVGHSMGGMATLSFAEQHPERAADLAGVALLSTAAGNVIAGGAFTAGAATLGALSGRLRPRLPWRRAAEDDDADTGAKAASGAAAGVAATAGGADAAGVSSEALTDLLDASGAAAEHGERHSPRDWTDTPSTDSVFLLTRAIGLGPRAHPAHVAFTEQLLRECPNRVMAALGPTLTSVRLTHVARQLTMPARVLVGDADRLTPQGQAERLAALMPRAEMAVIPDAGHMLPLEAHERVTHNLVDLADTVLA